MAEAERMYKLKSSDDRVVEVPACFIQKSVTLKNMLEDIQLGTDDPIPVPNVASNILLKVADYCIHHKDDEPVQEDEAVANKEYPEPQGFDAEFVRDIDQGTLFQLILAANFLDIKGMLDVTCQHVASMIRNKTPEEIRQTFNIKNDFTPAEEEQVKKENEWCEDRP